MGAARSLVPDPGETPPVPAGGPARYWFDQKTNREESWKLLERSIATNRN